MISVRQSSRDIKDSCHFQLRESTARIEAMRCPLAAHVEICPAYSRYRPQHEDHAPDGRVWASRCWDAAHDGTAWLV
jgi:hypothetical protein